MRVYLARHGRTSLNATGVLRGHLDPSLDDVGRRQAGALADALHATWRRPVQAVVSSPLRRATETAAPIAALARVDIEVDHRLIDRDYGPWAGRTLREIAANGDLLDDAAGVEPASEVLARAMLALDEIAERRDLDTTVVVSHDIVLRLLLSTLDPGLGDADSVPQETGCFNVVEHDSSVWWVCSVNNVVEKDDGDTER